MLIPKAGSVIAAVLLLFPSGLTPLPQRDVIASGGALVVGNLVKEGNSFEAGIRGAGGLTIKTQERRRPSPVEEPSSTMPTDSSSTEMPPSSTESEVTLETEGTESPSTEMPLSSTESEGTESPSTEIPSSSAETEETESSLTEMVPSSTESEMTLETEGTGSQSTEMSSSSTESEMTSETEGTESQSTEMSSSSTESEMTSETEGTESQSTEMQSSSTETQVMLETEGTKSSSVEMSSNSTESEVTLETGKTESSSTEMPSNSAHSEPEMVTERSERDLGSLGSFQSTTRCNDTYEDFVIQRHRCRMIRWRDDECMEFRFHYGDLADEDDDYDDDDYFDFWRRQVMFCGRDRARESVAGLTNRQGSAKNTVSGESASVVTQADARCNDTYEEFVTQRFVCRTTRWRSEECLEFRLHYGDLANEDDDFDDDDYIDFWKRQVILCNKHKDGRDIVAELMKSRPKFMSSRAGRFFTRSTIDGEDAAMNETSSEKPMEGGDVVGDAANTTSNSSPSEGESGNTGETASNTTSTNDMESMQSMNVTTSSENVNCTSDSTVVNGTVCENTNSTCRLQERCYSDSDCGGGKCVGMFAGTCNCSACRNFKPCLSDEGCGGLKGACDTRMRRCNCQAAYDSLGYKTPIGFLAKFCFNQFCNATSDTCHGLPCVFGRCFC